MTDLQLPDLAARLGPEGRREDLVAQVCGALRSRVQEGNIAPGTRLPSETTLAKNLGVSRPTLREATRILAQEGLLAIRHGVGTFVSTGGRHLTNPLDSMLSLSASIRAAGGVPHTRGLAIDLVAAPREVALALALAPKAPVLRIRRTRLIDDRPLGLAHEYLPETPSVDLASLGRFDGGSLYAFMTVSLGTPLLRSEVSVTAVSATVRQARPLSVQAGAPLLLMREIHFGEGGRRVLFSVNYHNSAVVDLTLVRAGVRT